MESQPEELTAGELGKKELSELGGGKGSQGQDAAKQLLTWLYKSKSARLTLRANSKGKNRFVWRQFRLAYIDDVEQPYAMCVDCQIFVKYSGRTGTGGLVRHHCFRRVVASLEPTEESPLPLALPLEVPKSASPSPSRMQVEELVHSNSPRVGYVPNYKGKSNVWAQFDIITIDNAAVNFAACKICRSIVTYVSRTGTGSMARHKCQMHKRPVSPDAPEDLAKRVKQEEEQRPESPVSPANLAQMHLSAFSHMLQANLDTYRKPPSPPSPPSVHREPPEESVRRDYAHMLRRSLDMFHAMRNEQFFCLAQSLVNLGAEYGKVDIRQMLTDSADVESVFNDVE